MTAKHYNCYSLSSDREDGESGSSVRFSDEEQRLLASLLRRSATAPAVPQLDDDLTPALRRRRQGSDKYVTDESQLNLRFHRRRARPNSAATLSDVRPTVRQRYARSLSISHSHQDMSAQGLNYIQAKLTRG
jgi:hypothetical protein